MSSSDNINDALKDILAGLIAKLPSDVQDKSKKKNSGSNGDANGITPSQALIISALLAGVLEVTSVLVDRNQIVQIVLTGSLKKKTELEKLLDQLGAKPFEEIIKAMLGRL